MKMNEICQFGWKTVEMDENMIDECMNSQYAVFSIVEMVVWEHQWIVSEHGAQGPCWHKAHVGTSLVLVWALGTMLWHYCLVLQDHLFTSVWYN
jgi:hypothetical protein